MSICDSETGACFLHTPLRPTTSGLVLTHGAGGTCESPLLISVADAFAASGMYVLRYDLPFRQMRPKGPPSGDGSMDRAGLSRIAAKLAEITGGSVYLGGHSYGGRQASILAAREPGICSGLLLLSYPLHPPEQPQKLRTSHFPELSKPVLFVQGARDAFASPTELEEAVTRISSPTEIRVIEGSGHDLKRGKFDILQSIVLPFQRLMGQQSKTG